MDSPLFPPPGLVQCAASSSPPTFGAPSRRHCGTESGVRLGGKTLLMRLVAVEGGWSELHGHVTSFLAPLFRCKWNNGTQVGREGRGGGQCVQCWLLYVLSVFEYE